MAEMWEGVGQCGKIEVGFDGCKSFLMEKKGERQELKTAMFWSYRFEVEV